MVQDPVAQMEHTAPGDQNVGENTPPQAAYEAEQVENLAEASDAKNTESQRTEERHETKPADEVLDAKRDGIGSDIDQSGNR